MKGSHKISIILAACNSIALITALALHAYIASIDAYIASIAQIHRIKKGDVIIHGHTFNGFIDNDTMAIGISLVSNLSAYVKIDRLPFSFGKVTIYSYGPDWLELSIGEKG